MENEIIGKIVTGILTAGVTLAVCLINNYYQSKREEKNREDANKKQLETIRSDYSGQISDLKTDFYAKFQELHTIVSTLMSDNKHQYDMIKMEIKVLSERQQAYNNLQMRTYELEKKADVQEEKMKVANNRLTDLEKAKQ